MGNSNYSIFDVDSGSPIHSFLTKPGKCTSSHRNMTINMTTSSTLVLPQVLAAPLGHYNDDQTGRRLQRLEI